MGTSIDTRLIHSGEPDPRIQGSVTMPIFQSAMFEYAGPEDDLRYVRLSNNPSQVAIQKKLADLEDAEAAIVTASGMAAISAALLSTLSPGDHILAQYQLYGGTHAFLTSFLSEYGVTYDFINPHEPDTWEAALTPATKALYVETISNPLIQVGDLSALATFAANHGLTSLIDNTFASPVNFRPGQWGFDLSIHSASKYLNGHSDLVAGAVIGSNRHIEDVRRKIVQLGGSLDPHACFLLHRGVKTLALRMQRQSASALALATALDHHSGVERVNYAGLPQSPSHANAVKHLDGFGGMLSFELRGGSEATSRFMHSLSIPILAPSLGGVETLLVRPALTSHAALTPGERGQSGVSDHLMRVSVGIESTEDLLDDFLQALDSI
jgi:cystathionine beta-lyase/cystathionine gamma-synthase